MIERLRYEIRLAYPEEVARIPALERAAAELFREAGLTGDWIDAVHPLDELAAAQREKRLWVVAAPPGDVVGFALAEMIGTTPHLAEIGVLPVHARRGLGRRLVAAVMDWARARNAESVTLSTFRDLAWNGPFYAKLGFREIPADELPAELRALVERERSVGLPVEQRVVMRCAL
jgi:GNAT superfamily N-acetyltransferase